MPLFVTPRQLTQRSEIYRQLAQLISAGIPIIKALEILAKNSNVPSYSASLRDVSIRLTQGETVGESWHYFGKWVPEFDIALVKAADKSGHLDGVFRMLADHYLNSAKILKQIISDMAYPTFVFHFAVVLFPFISLIQNGSLTLFFIKIFGVLIPLYLFVFVLAQVSQSTRGKGWRAKMEVIMRKIPLLGSGRHALSLSRLASALYALINAGVNIVEAWEMSAAASGSPALETAVLAWKPKLMSGSTPSELVNTEPRLFPEFFANIYNSGEVSGKLDESLKRISAYYLEEGSTKMHLLGQWLPRIFFMGLALLIGYKIISFYMGYFNTLNDVMNMK